MSAHDVGGNKMAIHTQCFKTNRSMNHCTPYCELGAMLTTVPNSNCSDEDAYNAMILEQTDYTAFSTGSTLFPVTRGHISFSTSVSIDESSLIA